MVFLLETLRLGLANLMLHKLRSLLTALGIIFGVAAVIAMVSIGEGNKQQALADIRQLGARNIIIRSIKPPDSGTMAEGNERVSSYGLTRRDVRHLTQAVWPVDRIVPVKRVGNQVFRGVRRAPGETFVAGTTPDLASAISLRVIRGRYLTDQDMARVDNVAVIGADLAARLFPMEDPIGGVFNIDGQVYEVVGVLGTIGLAGGAGASLVGRDLNLDIHIPMSSALSRFGDVRMQRGSGSSEASNVEVSELIVQVPTDGDVLPVAEQVRRAIAVRHAELGDVKTFVPLELLAQVESTQAMFNALMISIASISLLVGGIGIMNIMLASVTERTREIGIRRALGATRRHIVAQFLVETTVLSGIGGLIGVALGLAGAAGLALLLWWGLLSGFAQPQVTTWSIVVSFVVATSVGVVFGLYPAVQASRQDPIVALRHD